MSRLLFVRHGETLRQSSERFWGQTDVELSALGRKQAESLRDLLATQQIDTIYASDLKRALVTAQVIASRQKVEIITCPELREANFGELEGLTFAEISQRYPEVTESWMAGGLDITYPGGENLNAFIERTTGFTDRLQHLSAEQTALVVAHGGPLRIILCHLLDFGPEHWWQLQVDLASFSIVKIESRGPVLSLFNHTAHLEEATQ
jgi:alpha-ribazole phosphatase